MGEYYVSYRGKERVGVRNIYQVDFLRRNTNGQFYKAFSSFPAVQLNERMGNVYEPYVNAFPLRDYFTYITFAQLPVEGEMPPEERLLGAVEFTIGDTIACQHRKLIFKSLEAPGGISDKLNFTLVAQFELMDQGMERVSFSVKYIVNQGRVSSPNTDLIDKDLRFRFTGLSDIPNTIMLDKIQVTPDFIIMKTTIFPYINLLWLSSLVVLAGLIIAFANRIKNRKSAVE